jgi:2-polyprenyl-6-methoxyphenol hydroxylase-like FAD-dependent oxidoreductase
LAERLDIEVAIAGGGPAGAACALVLAGLGREVAVFERTNEPLSRPGETLPPPARAVLEELGLWRRFLQDEPLPSYSIEARWGGAETTSTDFILSPYGCGYHVDRARFDAMVLDAAAAAGARIHRGVRVRGAMKECDRANVQLDDGRSLSTRFVVDAGGRTSRLLGGCRSVHDRLVGVSVRLAPAEVFPLDPLLLVEAVEEGWWYSAPLPQGGLIAVLMTDADLLPSAPARARWFAERLERAPTTAARTRGLRAASGLQIAWAASSRLEKPVGTLGAAVGDAAAAHDPLAGTGMVKALRDGSMLGHSIDDALRGRPGALAAYGARVEEGFARYLDQRTLYYRRERRFASSAFWMRRHADSAAGT